jgi:hypothetical protein
MPDSVETVEIQDPDAPGEYLIINRADMKPENRLRGADPKPAERPATLPEVTTPDDPDAERQRRGPGRPRKGEE